MENIPEDLKVEIAKKTVPKIEVILGHTFKVWQNDASKDYWVRLTPENLLLSPIRETQSQNCCSALCKPQEVTLHKSDILACHPASQQNENSKFNPRKSGQPIFMILAYPEVKGGGKRTRKVLYFHIDSKNQSSEENLWHEASRLRDTWVHAILTTFFRPHEEPGHRQLSHHHKRLLLVLNTHAGKGHATKLMRNRIGPILQDAGVEYEVLVTERQGHSHEIVQAEPKLAKRWKGIVVVGGDGSFYEVLNGIFARPDWRDVFKQVPLGIIPCGSGNGLSRSLIHTLGESFDGCGVISSIVNVARGNRQPLDLYLAETKAEDGIVQQNVGSLQISYGISSDVDIESEVIRGLGTLRFTIYAILRIANLRKYKVKLWYKKAFSKNENQDEPFKEEEDIYSEAKTVSSSETDDEESEREKSESEQEINFQKQEIPTSQNEDSEEDKEEEGTKVDSDDENSEDNDQEKSEVNSLHDDGDSNEASSEMSENENDEAELEVQEVTMDIGASTNHGSEIMTHDSPYFPGGHRATYGLMLAQGHLYFRSWNELQATLLPQMVEFKPLPPMPPRPARQKLDTEVPELSQDLKTESHDGWIYEENEFINVSILNAPYITECGKFSPESQLDDGLLYLLLIRKEASKKDLVNIFNSLEVGNHIQIPGVEIIPVHAVRFLPSNLDIGTLTIDGESIPVGPIQAQVLPSMANLYVK